jgi:hypothetical protein
MKNKKYRELLVVYIAICCYFCDVINDLRNKFKMPCKASESNTKMSEELKSRIHAIGMMMTKSPLMRMNYDMRNEHKSLTPDRMLAETDLMLLQSAVYL